MTPEEYTGAVLPDDLYRGLIEWGRDALLAGRGPDELVETVREFLADLESVAGAGESE